MKHESVLNLKGVYGLNLTTDGDLITYWNSKLQQIY
jgi:hypothetical protein